LGAGTCWALYIVFGQKAGAEHGVQMTAIGVAIAAACILPFGLAQAGASLFTPSIFPFAIAVAVLSTALPYSLEMVGLSRLPAKTFGTLMSLEPAFGALSGLVFLHEQLAPVQWLAIGAIISASAGSTATAVRKEEVARLSDPPAMGGEDER
jgi:inner membrane transporter RhtA